jgi:hypothetical protein
VCCRVRKIDHRHTVTGTHVQRQRAEAQIETRPFDRVVRPVCVWWWADRSIIANFDGADADRCIAADWEADTLGTGGPLTQAAFCDALFELADTVCVALPSRRVRVRVRVRVARTFKATDTQRPHTHAS